MERCYGFFRCTGCRKEWESSHVYRQKDTKVVQYKQDCKACNTPCLPYHTEKIKCSMCDLTDCICSEDDLDMKRHINPSKPHLASLCHKCRAGKPCQNSY